MTLRSQLAAGGLLLILLAQMAFSAPHNSVAFDETFDITYGYAYLRTGDARLSRGHNPPLGDMLLASPLLLRDDVALPIEHPTWADADIFGFSNEFLWKANADKAHALVMQARWPAMGLATLLAALVFTGARRIVGRRAGLLALTLAAFDPNLIANGRVVGSDLSVTVFLFGAVLAFDRALAANSRRSAALAGLFGGAALASKYSALWLIPMLIGIAVLHPVQGALKHAIARRLTHLLIVGSIGLGVIWAAFGFQVTPLVPDGLPLPAADYWLSMNAVRDRVASSTPAFLNGRISVDGFWEYYPVAFAVKTPLPTLILTLAGAIALIRRRERRTVALWLPVAVFFGAATLGRLNLGYRLILPVLPFALVIAAGSVDWLGSRAARAIAGFRQIAGVGSGRHILGLRRLTPLRFATGAGEPALRTPYVIGALTIAWLAIGTLSVFPNHLTFFNELAGGPANGYRLLVDSNYDWGQDLIALQDWMDRRGVDRVSLAYFGSAHPDAYGLRADLLPGFNRNEFGPEVEGYSAYATRPGWTAISATTLQLGLLFTHWDAYAAFRDRMPDDRVGSILLYRIPDTSGQRARTIVLGPAAIDLDGATLGAGAGTELCVAWAGDGAAIFAMDGPARYITRGGQPLAGFAPDVHQALIARARRLGSDASGALRLFEIDARDALAAKIDALAQVQVAAPDGAPIVLPIEFEGGLTLLGYDLVSAADRPIELVTYWQVRQRPTLRLAIFAHLLDSENRLLGQADGLNVRLSSLETGDLVLQHFVIDRPGEAMYLDIGLYDPASNRRMLGRLPNGPTFDRGRVRLIDEP